MRIFKICNVLLMNVTLRNLKIKSFAFMLYTNIMFMDVIDRLIHEIDPPSCVIACLKNAE